MVKRLVSAAVLVLVMAWSAPPLLSFCGFYVAKADTKLFNKASQVVLVRDGDRTVMTMASDFQGDPKEFAVVIPVPTFLRREQIHVGDKALVEHLDAYSAPRLVEYFDGNPCRLSDRMMMRADARGCRERRAAARERSLGVTIEARYTVGEYDILILSAAPELGPGNLAARERLRHSGRRLACHRQLPQTEHEVLRRQGQPGGAGEARVHLSAAAADRL